MSHGRTYDEQRYSPLALINQANVDQLGLAWYAEVDTSRGQEATPIVVDGALYVSTAWSMVYAFDVESGEQLWKHDPRVDREKGRYACCDVVNRGVAVWTASVRGDYRRASGGDRFERRQLGMGNDDHGSRPAVHDHRRAARSQGPGYDRQRRRGIWRARLCDRV